MAHVPAFEKIHPDHTIEFAQQLTSHTRHRRQTRPHNDILLPPCTMPRPPTHAPTSDGSLQATHRRHVDVHQREILWQRRRPAHGTRHKSPTIPARTYVPHPLQSFNPPHNNRKLLRLRLTWNCHIVNPYSRAQVHDHHPDPDR